MMHVVIISSSSSKAKKKNQDISLCAASCVLQSLFWNNPDYDQQQSKRERQREMKGGIKLQITAAIKQLLIPSQSQPTEWQST